MNKRTKTITLNISSVYHLYRWKVWYIDNTSSVEYDSDITLVTKRFVNGKYETTREIVNIKINGDSEV